MYRTTGAAVVLVMSFFAGCMAWPSVVNAISVPPVSFSQAPATRDDTCLLQQRSVVVEGLGERTICASGGEVVVGHVSRSGATPLAVRLSYDPQFSEVTNVCRSGGCAYAAETDVLWERRLDSGINFSLHRYEGFSRHLASRYDTSSARWTYEYTGPAPVRVYSGISAYALSANGHWLVMEIRNKGIATIRAEDGAMRRVTPLLHQYGRGYDPSYQLAIQNDGRRVFLGGQNVSPRLVEVTDRCGDSVVSGLNLSDGFLSGVTACESETLSFVPTLPTYRYVHHPQFEEERDALVFMVRSMAGSDYHARLEFSPESSPKLAYVALGDSFTSGEGEESDGYYLPGTNTPNNRCHVSTRSYPYLLTGTPLPVQSVACSGATSRHITAPHRDLPAQIVAVREHQPRVVTVGVGGNDIDLVGKLAACAGPGTCVWARPEYRFLTAQEATQLVPTLAETFTTVRHSAPLARVVIVGYPIAMSLTGECDVLTSVLLSGDERRYLVESQQLLNRVLAIAAHMAGVEYVDVSTAYTGHELCAGSSTPAMNGLRLGGDIAPINSLPGFAVIGNESFHPTPLGHRRVADRLDSVFAQPPTPLCTGTECRVLIEVGDDYWSVAETQQLVYRLEHDRFDDGGVVLSSSGLFAPLSTVSISLFSEEIALGSVASDAGGSVRIDVPAEQLTGGTHTLLLRGVNHRQQPIVGYAIIRAVAAEDASSRMESVEILSGREVDARTSSSTQSVARVDESRPAQPNDSSERQMVHVAAVLGTMSDVSQQNTSTAVSSATHETLPVLDPWLAPIFATIGVSLGIIALWLYFVRS